MKTLTLLMFVRGSKESEIMFHSMVSAADVDE